MIRRGNGHGIILGSVRFVRVRQPEAGKPAPGKILADLSAECDAVVNGIAD